MATWKGVDPSKRYRASEVLSGLEGYAGRSLTDQDRSTAFSALGRNIGSADEELSGDEYNTLLRTGAGMTGGATFEPFGGGGPAPPPGAKKWDWDTIDAAPAFNGPAAFKHEGFQVPGAAGMYADPGYQFRLDEGRKALEASKAGSGKFASGETLRALTDYGQGMASQEYGNVFNRATTAYGLNRGNAADMWDKEMDLSQLQYAPEFATWQAQNAAKTGRGNAEFDREWQREIYYNDDRFRKAVFGSDDEFRRAVQAENNTWKRELLEEERLKFLTQMGR
ncbi:MAG: hypothetical protein H0W42_02945 [Gemmatimonadaceae bacterium]|nr:hypothetical protein [Gemmatimonadaceae bacterium]